MRKAWTQRFRVRGHSSPKKVWNLRLWICWCYISPSVNLFMLHLSVCKSVHVTSLRLWICSCYISPSVNLFMLHLSETRLFMILKTRFVLVSNDIRCLTINWSRELLHKCYNAWHKTTYYKSKKSHKKSEYRAALQVQKPQVWVYDL